MGEEFHAVLKLITGEEIFSLVSVDENDGDSIIMLSNPVIMKMLSSPAGKYVKVKPWLELPDQDLFLIKYDKIVTMSEVTDEQMIKFYNRYLNDDDIDIEVDGQVSLTNKMGLLTTVDDARLKLEEILLKCMVVSPPTVLMLVVELLKKRSRVHLKLFFLIKA